MIDFQNLSSQNLSEKNQNLQSENRRLRERLLELYVQINTLASLSDDLGINIENDAENKYEPAKKQLKPLRSWRFIQSENTILPGGAIYSAAIDPKSDNVALASLSGNITIMPASLKVGITINAHTLACRDVYWGSVGLVSCGFDKYIRIWDVQTQTSQNISTKSLAHSVCGLDDDSNTVFGASGDQVFWVDTRRQTPITLFAGAPVTAVSCTQNLLLFGGYDGFVSVVDRRSLHAGTLAHLDIGGPPISSLSRVLPTGQCIATTTKNRPNMIVIGDNIEQHELPIEAPGRFGCRADITEKSLIFDGDYATVCGGKMAIFCDGAKGSRPQYFEDVGGFEYGAIFMTNISQKVLTYSEDGVVTVWSLRQM